MEMLTQKKEIIDWISSLDNPLILNNIYNIKNQPLSSFEERCEKGLTLEQFRAEMKRRIRNYPIRK